MRKRYVVLGLSAFLALALAVPALGGPSNPVADVSVSAKKLGKRALKKARGANKRAKQAQVTADDAQQGADDALARANNALDSAEAAGVAAINAQETADSKLGNVQQIAGEPTATNGITPKTSTAICPGGTIPTGGSHSVGGGDSNDVSVTSNGDPLYGSGWFATGQEVNAATSWSISATAYCATTSTP